MPIILLYTTTHVDTTHMSIKNMMNKYFAHFAACATCHSSKHVAPAASASSRASHCASKYFLTHTQKTTSISELFHTFVTPIEKVGKSQHTHRHDDGMSKRVPIRYQHGCGSHTTMKQKAKKVRNQFQPPLNQPTPRSHSKSISNCSRPWKQKTKNQNHHRREDSFFSNVQHTATLQKMHSAISLLRHQSYRIVINSAGVYLCMIALHTYTHHPHPHTDTI